LIGAEASLLGRILSMAPIQIPCMPAQGRIAKHNSEERRHDEGDEE
jgi:hypothetical protein